jgi:hypothetical protein
MLNQEILARGKQQIEALFKSLDQIKKLSVLAALVLRFRDQFASQTFVGQNPKAKGEALAVAYVQLSQFTDTLLLISKIPQVELHQHDQLVQLSPFLKSISATAALAFASQNNAAFTAFSQDEGVQLTFLAISTELLTTYADIAPALDQLILISDSLRPSSIVDANMFSTANSNSSSTEGMRGPR